MKRVMIFSPFFEGTGENMNQIMESAIGQGGARSMRGYQEVKFGEGGGQRSLRRCIEVNEW